LKLSEVVLVSPMLVNFPDTVVEQSSTMDVKVANRGLSGTIWVVKSSNATTGKKRGLSEGCTPFE
uniref:MSP domain-containing protein n=1 Tax=Hydatigena taeniaeformis TaxID=6205 RepID=A0A0R3WY90_HYDTA